MCQSSMYCETGTPTDRTAPENAKRSHEKDAMPLEAEVSLRRRMEQNMLITALIVTSGLKLTGENISRQIA